MARRVGFLQRYYSAVRAGGGAVRRVPAAGVHSDYPGLHPGATVVLFGRGGVSAGGGVYDADGVARDLDDRIVGGTEPAHSHSIDPANTRALHADRDRIDRAGMHQYRTGVAL